MGYSFVAVKNNEKIIYNRPFNLAFYIAASVAGAGIVWTLYNGLASELNGAMIQHSLTGQHRSSSC